VSWRGLQACVMATEEQRAQKVKGRELGLTRQLRRAYRLAEAWCLGRLDL
jgi:hypothetical protein